MDIEKYEQLLKESLELGPYATFVPNKHQPVYNWFYFKEGFSRELVEYFLSTFDITSGTVLDPFCGSGTTLLACKQRGISAIGFDVMPMAVFASRIKIQDYNPGELEEKRGQLLKVKFTQIPMQFPKFFYRYFSKYALGDIALFLRQLEALSEPSKSFFLLALINSAVKVSWAFKDGAVLKVRKQGNIPLRKMFARVTARMISDLRSFKAKPCEIEIRQQDARKMEMPDNSTDAIITSPPYLNQIDYTKVYSIENWFVGKAEPALRSFIGFESEPEDFLGLSLPSSANTYFKDMQLALREMYRVCAPDAKVAIVVGNAYFLDRDLIVDSDLIISALAEEIGFKVKEIRVFNKRCALEHRTIKKGVLRESMILMEK